jgi:hypothetical protein
MASHLQGFYAANISKRNALPGFRLQAFMNLSRFHRVFPSTLFAPGIALSPVICTQQRFVTAGLAAVFFHRILSGCRARPEASPEKSFD